ncbi:DUF262 domain-containing protein [Sphingopyxis terrae]|uniref:DUF262 domain-containing protein n=1 Tax=Sphingopyxis terrae TaxID=33052 RepID=UPI001C2C94E9|nr:DUF262 domain-containing protein [Sphingopyxis terrae]QXF12876.1 DUF262 domain-containing protein [Sphingopyxis terrae subsp. terrae]
MQLTPQHLTIEQLLQGRLFRIPDYQRAYSWGKKQRADLLHDILEVHRSDRDHFMATIVALGGEYRTMGADRFRDVSLVDGQQRITTLIILLKAIEKSLDDESKDEAEAKSQLRRLIVKADDHNLVLLQTNHDSSQVFANYVRAGQIGTAEVVTAADMNVVDAANEAEQFVSEWVASGSIIELLGTIRHKLSVIYHELQDEASVYRVFEVLNSRGLDVRWIDKTKSQLLASIYEFVDEGLRSDALHEQKTIWQDIYRYLGLEEGIGDEALRFAGTLKCKERPNRVLSDRDASLAILDIGGDNVRSLSEAGNWLKNVVRTVVDLRQQSRLSAVLKTQQARFLAVAIKLRQFKPEVERDLLRVWENVTFRIFTLAGKDSRSKVGEYVRLGHDIVASELSAEEILERLTKLGAGFSMKEVIGKSAWEGWYPDWSEDVRYVLYRYEEHCATNAGTDLNEAQWSKVWTADPSKSIEHILPQSSGKGFIHDLGNLTMLPPGVNSSLKDKPPKSKAKRYTECGLEITMAVGRQILRDGKWNKAAARARGEAIGEFIKNEWSE